MYIPKIDFKLMFDSIPFVLSGLKYTIGLSVASFFLGNVLGLVLTVLGMTKSKILQYFVRFYVSFLRGVPALVLLFLLYFGLPIQLSALVASIICFTLSSSAFVCEIYRGAILGVPFEQWDASYSQGFTFIQSLRYIIIPQAFRISIPALGNVAMDLVKGTSLAAMITIPDIFQKAKIVGGRTFDYMTMYIMVAIIYWLLCIGIGCLQKKLEKSLNRYIDVLE
ncbi:amino acid ABC transporter permease [Floricoccus penangensis]|uniref:amino acid ABC transporter permease n=1 Tax=Floricoccus penangensis TaxID=1859475 RepID=UPI00203CF8F7|nr:amino acid ABC transporter permease [Floricoccus penangensis]URZ87161.1 amino acid ABC transporter permease [Floricoccus penangensis]